MSQPAETAATKPDADARLDRLEAMLGTVLERLAQPAPAPPARAANGGGAFVTEYPAPQEAAAAVKAAVEARLAGLDGVAVEPVAWQHPEGASGPLQAQLAVRVTAPTALQPEVQLRLNGVPGPKRPGGPPVYDHCILMDTAPPADGRRVDTYGLFARVTVPASV